MRWYRRIPAPLGSVLFGASTLIVTPILSALVALLLLTFTGYRQGSAVELIGKVFHLEGLGGFFGAMAMLGVLFWIIGSAVSALLCWLFYRDRRLVWLTLASAFGFHMAWTVLFVTIETTSQGRDSARVDAAMEAVTKRIAGFASLGEPEVSVRDRHDDWGDDYPQFGPYYQFMDVSVPIDVRRAGSYRVELRYRGGPPQSYGSRADLDTTLSLDPGRDTLRLSFRPSMYRSPEYTGGSTRMMLYGLLSSSEYFGLVKEEPGAPRRRIQKIEAYGAAFGNQARDELVDSVTATMAPRLGVPRYVPKRVPSDRDDRGRRVDRDRRPPAPPPPPPLPLGRP